MAPRLTSPGPYTRKWQPFDKAECCFESVDTRERAATISSLQSNALVDVVIRRRVRMAWRIARQGGESPWHKRTNESESHSIPSARAPEPRSSRRGSRIASSARSGPSAGFRGLYQIYLAGMHNPGRPIGTILFLGPTGSGKTRVVEAAAEVLFGDPNAVVKIDCAEFQHSHEIAKLIGSPPGYLGHRETSPMLTQENLDRYHTEQDKTDLRSLRRDREGVRLALAAAAGHSRQGDADARRQPQGRLLAHARLHDLEPRRQRDERADLRARSALLRPRRQAMGESEVDQKIYRTALEAARRKFSPEFMNRIDKVVVFRSCERITSAPFSTSSSGRSRSGSSQSAGAKFVFQCTDSAKEFLLDEGIDFKYGARHLKRAIERFLVYPLSNLVATEQVETGDLVLVDRDPETGKMLYSKEVGGALVGPLAEEFGEHFQSGLSEAAGASGTTGQLGPSGDA